MKNRILCLMLLASSVVYAKPSPKDPRIDVAKRASIELFRQHLGAAKPSGEVSVRVLEQSDEFFLTQVTVSQKKSNYSFCLVLAVAISEDGTPGVAYLENNNDVRDVYIQQCSTTPDVYELAKIKFQNVWPVKE